MSRDKGKTTAKKSHSEATSPKTKKKKEEINPFFSLSNRHISHLPVGRKMSKKSQSLLNSVSPSGSVTGTPKQPTLQEKLSELVPAIGTTTGSQAHEIMRGLNKSHITDWNGFIDMDEADLPLMLQNIGGSDKPLSAASHRIINNILRMVWRNMENNVVDAENPATYTHSMYREYVKEMRMLKKTKNY